MGELMDDTIFKVAFMALWIVYIAIRAPFDKQYKQTEKLKAEGRNSERIVLGALAVGMLSLPLLWVFSPFLHRFDIHLPVWVRWSGVALAVWSLVYFRRVHQALGANWSPTLEIRKEHKLVQTGPYKNIRHPMYTQMLVWTLSQALIISNAVAGFSGLVTWLVLYLLRVPKEEKMMKEQFGEEYTAYMSRTGRILPKL